MIKKIAPFIILSLFVGLIAYFYTNNKSEFDFLYNLNVNFILRIFFLCFLYLLTESFIFKNISKFFYAKIGIFNSFLIISTTYLCNTFVQFSGLGYRAYYLKKFKKIRISNFIIKSIFIIFIEIIVFSSLSLLLLFLFDKINLNIEVYSYLYFLLVIILILSLIGLFFYKQIIYVIKKINFINKIKVLSTFIKLVDSFDKQRFDKFIKKYVLLFLIQFLILFLIFFDSYAIFEKDNSFLLSTIATMSTDLSFLFTLTPYAVGISETFIFFSSNNLDIKVSEILFLTNIFRLSMFAIYFIFGLINLFLFSKSIIK